jgi:hypothetical protein
MPEVAGEAYGWIRACFLTWFTGFTKRRIQLPQYCEGQLPCSRLKPYSTRRPHQQVPLHWEERHLPLRRSFAERT